MQLKFGVVGYPIGHSMSPFIQKELFLIGGIDADYNKYEISPENLREEFENRLKEFTGFNVTIPHKVDIIPLLNALDGVAAEYGAVNTVKKEKGKYIGYNTDAYGFLRGLEYSNIPLEGRVVIFGYGGAARTIITESLRAGCEVVISTEATRRKKADAVAAEFAEKFGRAIPIVTPEEFSGEYDLFINASPIGMYPKTEVSPLSDAQVQRFKYVYDIVYNPVETLLLKQSKRAGKISGGGLSMLVLQAEKAQNHWYGAKFTPDQTSAIIEKAANKLAEDFGR